MGRGFGDQSVVIEGGLGRVFGRFQKACKYLSQLGRGPRGGRLMPSYGWMDGWTDGSPSLSRACVRVRVRVARTGYEYVGSAVHKVMGRQHMHMHDKGRWGRERRSRRRNSIEGGTCGHSRRADRCRKGALGSWLMAAY
jgi:hypothetical protein